LPGATKGNTLEAARIELCDGDSKPTVKLIDLQAVTTSAWRSSVRTATPCPRAQAERHRHFLPWRCGPGRRL